MNRSALAAPLGALCYLGWGVFHIGVAHDIYQLGLKQAGIAQGRTFQLAAYMLTIALFAIAVALIGNWRNQRVSYWMNLCVIGWADAVVVVVAPGYVPLLRGLLPPLVYLIGAALTTMAYRPWLKSRGRRGDRPGPPHRRCQ